MADLHDLAKRFEACMVLAGVGDAIGYKNGAWEFCRSGVRIHEQLELLGGLENIKVDPKNWMISDDTIMHIATAEALVSDWGTDYIKLYSTIAKCYKECFHDMAGRAPGITCGQMVHQLRPLVKDGYIISFNERGGGCGAAMRSVPIGLLYWEPKDLPDLVRISIESGRMTHNHPTGFLGSLATALFVSYSMQHKPLKEWGAGLIKTLDVAMKYIEDENRDVKKNKTHWSYFKDRWTQYLTLRNILDGKSDPKFPKEYGVQERDDFYRSISYSGTGGASGHDAPMIAYDALLSCGDSWFELCHRSMLHGGDSDSTGIIAAACWGAMYGYKDVPEGHYKKLEYVDRLRSLAKKLYEKNRKE